jgi:ubiquinone/menaquinone biosynthesis C-methylase UbiE
VAEYALQLSDAEIQRYTLMAELARQSEAELWVTARITTGSRVGDIGCGPGAMFPALVAAVGDSGTVRGVDGNPTAVAQATALANASGWTNVEVGVGRADETGVPEGSLDAVMMRHVLAHNGPDEQAIVDHLATLVRPGGCVYLVDVDASLFRVDPTHPDLEHLNQTYERFHAAKGNDLKVGLRLPQLAERAGLEVADYRGWFNIVQPTGEIRPPSWAAREAMIASGHATHDDVERWERAFVEMAPERPRIFAPLFGCVARRPG